MAKDKDDKFRTFATIAGTAVVTAVVYYMVNDYLNKRKEMEALEAAKKLKELSAAEE